MRSPDVRIVASVGRFHSEFREKVHHVRRERSIGFCGEHDIVLVKKVK